LNGARKLLKARPLERMLALDEFLPIMYNQHPNPNWSSKFEPKDLRAFAVYPVAVEPEKYTHQPGYVSDTENSPIIVELRLEDNEKNSEEYAQDMGKGEITTEGIAEMQRDIKIKDEF
jgi:collagen beta-1,O-galactosyltransferase